MKKILLISFIAILGANTSFAQDPHFSQIQYNPIYLNPANAGITEYGKANRVAGTYRDQWRTLPVPYSTTFASYDRLFKKFNGGWILGGGISFLYDRAGEGNLSIYNPNLTISGGKYFNSDKQLLTLGVTAGITIKSMDFQGLQFDNQYNGSTFDPNLPTGETFSNNNVSFPNFTIGLLFRTKIKDNSSLDVGASAANLHQPEQNFLYYTSSKLATRYSAYAKAKVGIKEKWNVQPGVFFQNQKKANQILINAIAETRFGDSKDFGVGFGAGYRAIDNDAAIAYVSFLYKTLRAGFAYDFNVSGLSKGTKGQGAFELALTYEFGEIKEGKRKKCDTIRIPQIEILHDTVYVHDTLTVTNEVVKPVEVEKPCTSIAKEFNLMLPAAVYFSNAIPSAKDGLDTTTENYKNLYASYVSKKDIYSKKTSAADADELFGKIEASFTKLDTVCDKLEKYLKEGKSITLNLRGYTSPLAKEDYNYHLSKRRIVSVRNYLANRNNGVLREYIESGKLKFELLPFGKLASPAGISDQLKDSKNSIYGKDASLERRVEIIYVGVE